MYRPQLSVARRLLDLALPVGLLLVGCGGRADEHQYRNPRVPRDRLPETSGSFVELRCGRDRAIPGVVTQCGRVEVPVAPDSSETLELSVVRVFTDSTNPDPDPVIYLDGGPGVATLDSVEYMVDALRPMYPNRDLIFFDQRGVGRSEPELTCDESGTIDEVLQSCFERWSARVDLNDYRTVNNAHDVRDIATAFGYQQVNLLGISYGTRLALTVMREHPEVVRSVVIDSVVPLQVDLFAETAVNGESALSTVFEACAADAACVEKYPDPFGKLLSLMEKLNDNPVPVGRFQIDGNQFVNIIFQMMYSAELIGYIPYFIEIVDAGETTQLESIFAYTSDESGFAFGMHLSLQCAEEIAFSSRSAFEERDALVAPPLREALSAAVYLDYCEYWPVEAAPPIENEPVESAIPTLVLAGRFDPITPPTFSLAAFDYLSTAQFFQLDSESHGASISDCGSDLVRTFTDNPRGIVEPSCVLNPPGLDFQSESARATTRNLGGRVRWQIDTPSLSDLEDAVARARLRRKMVRR